MTPPRIDPTAHDIRPEDNRLSRRSAVVLTAVFLLLITLPGVWREFSKDAVRGSFAHIADWQDGKVVDRLRTVEKAIDNGAWTKPVRQHVQTVLYQVFREGNRKVVVGRDGWLFHRPGIRALTGRGPVLGPAKTSAKGHQKVEAWEGPIPVIKEFAAQLKERNIQLVLVPVPDKARELHSGHILGVANFFTELASRFSKQEVLPLKKHPDLREKYPFLETLHTFQLGIAETLYNPWRVRDRSGNSHPDKMALFDELKHNVIFLESRKEAFPYLITVEYLIHGSSTPQPFRGKTETHLPPLTTKILSRLMALTLPIDIDYDSIQKNSENSHYVRSSYNAGDLLRSLDLPHTQQAASMESYEGSVSNVVHKSDPSSPIVLLGDSNVNMYDDPGLPFYMPGAGLGSWLSAYLGQPLHIIAINGGGATAVRQRFAALPDDVVRAKKLVIWVIAERDLFMDPAVARENNVEWKRVVFNPNQSSQHPPTDPAAPADALVVEATVKAKSAMPAPHEVNYPDSVYVAEFTVDKVVSGSYAEPELQVVLWNFRNREVQPSARLAVGQKVRLTLSDWLAQGDLTKTNASDDIGRFDIPLMFAEKIEASAP